MTNPRDDQVSCFQNMGASRAFSRATPPSSTSTVLPPRPAPGEVLACNSLGDKCIRRNRYPLPLIRETCFAAICNAKIYTDLGVMRVRVAEGHKYKPQKRHSHGKNNFDVCWNTINSLKRYSQLIYNRYPDSPQHPVVAIPLAGSYPPYYLEIFFFNFLHHFRYNRILRFHIPLHIPMGSPTRQSRRSRCSGWQKRDSSSSSGERHSPAVVC